MIVFLTGACGVGKTTLLKHLQEILPSDKYEFYQTDDTPLPSNEEVQRLYVNGWEGWQKVHMRYWVDRLMPLHNDKTIFWDGQTNMDFLETYLNDYLSEDYRIVLVECDVDERFRRLIEERNQPELAQQDQVNWRNFLHRQAIEKNAFILDSTHMGTAELAKALLKEIED